tara:strand:- start:638 stop:1285 length:648 start_codon:yes stop_codon:yes gene_type:complete
MFVSYYNVKYKCWISKTGYEWDKNQLVPKSIESISKEYEPQTYDDFRRLVKYSFEGKDKYKEEIKRFARLWGNPFRNPLKEIQAEIYAIKIEQAYTPVRFGLNDFDKAIKFFKDIRENFQKGIVPKPKKLLPSKGIMIEYEWDEESNQIMPTYKARNLWEAIQFTIVFSGYDAQKVGEICQRDGCDNRVISKRSDTKYCSEYCRFKAKDKRKANS